MAEILKYLEEGLSEIQPGTIDMEKAQVAKSIVDQEPSLLLPENESRLFDEIERRYRANSIDEDDDVTYFQRLADAAEH